MLPIEHLMIEHRLIDRVLLAMETEHKKITSKRAIDPGLIDVLVDFARTYADRVHHGKEEEILFKRLGEKPIPDDLRAIADELTNEHKIVRNRTTQLVAAKELYEKGSREALQMVTRVLTELLALYPAHIEKEEKRFFVPVMEYFTDEEKARMAADFREFDSQIIHEKYTRIVEALEEESGCARRPSKKRP